MLTSTLMKSWAIRRDELRLMLDMTVLFPHMVDILSATIQCFLNLFAYLSYFETHKLQYQMQFDRGLTPQYYLIKTEIECAN
jgi:hypothetical protein